MIKFAQALLRKRRKPIYTSQVRHPRLLPTSPSPQSVILSGDACFCASKSKDPEGLHSPQLFKPFNLNSPGHSTERLALHHREICSSPTTFRSKTQGGVTVSPAPATSRQLGLNRVLVGAIRRSKRSPIDGDRRTIAATLAVVIVDNVEPQIKRIQNVGSQESRPSGVAIATFG
jgi:hypothetical protein